MIDLKIKKIKTNIMNKIFRKVISTLSVLAVLGMVGFTAFAAADTKNPSDVENLKGTAQDKAVTLTWDAATDDVAVTGYQVHYGLNTVGSTGSSYDMKKDTGNVLEYKVEGLENDTTYYFSVVAYDAAGNESLRWAKEVSYAPTADAADILDVDAPKVSSSEAMNIEQVKVVFSEEVVLPTVDPHASFTVENDDTLSLLDVTGAKLDPKDPANKTVILDTKPQEEGVLYKLTVSVDIKDKAGNVIVSGTSDTAIFEGSALVKALEDTQAPTILSVDSFGNTSVVLRLDESVVIALDPSTNFEIKEKDNPKNILSVLGVEFIPNEESPDHISIDIVTSAQSEVVYTIKVVNLKDAAGNLIAEENATMEFTGKVAGEVVDVTPPKDVTALLNTVIFKNQKYQVTFNWENPEENMGDTVKQLLYLSYNLGETYNVNTTLLSEVDEYAVDGLAPGEYWVKLTQQDAAGNESEGTLTKIVLAETGPGIVGAFMLSIGLGRVYRKKRQ